MSGFHNPPIATPGIQSTKDAPNRRMRRLVHPWNRLELDKSLYYQQISSSDNPEPELRQDSTRIRELSISDSVETLVERAEPLSRSVEKALTNGIQDITDTMTGEYNITQILQLH